MSMLTLRQAPPGCPARQSDWPSPASIPPRWMTLAFAGSAGFAVVMALVTTYDAHRMWGVFAGCSYLLAAMAVVVWKSRGLDVALVISLAGALIAPMWLMAADRVQQPEVQVIDQSAAMLLHRGTPYPGPALLAATHNPNVFDPYLPALTAFGIPRVLLGFSPVTDPRIWFGAVFLVVFAVALRIAGARDSFRWALLMTASPIIAFELCVGGTDVPMVAFMCLGFAFLWRRHGAYPVTAGLALGIASSMKATAWPALVVAFALLYVRDGQRAAWRFIAVALSVVLVIVGPFAVLRPGSLVKNTILFPLGLASVKSQAASPLLGHVLAQTGRLGHTIVVILLIGSGLAIAVSLVVRPPRDVPAATIRLVLGLSAMFVLAPSTRFGYFIYPAAMVLWLLVAGAGRTAAFDSNRSPDPSSPLPPPAPG